MTTNPKFVRHTHTLSHAHRPRYFVILNPTKRLVDTSTKKIFTDNLLWIEFPLVVPLNPHAVDLGDSLAASEAVPLSCLHFCHSRPRILCSSSACSWGYERTSAEG